MNLSIIIPTYNEKENIPILLEIVFKIFKKNKINGEVIVVDDNSPDGTGKIVDNLKKKHKNLRVLHRPEKMGLASGALDGFNMAKGEILGLMDGDLSHPPEKIIEMLKYIEENKADLVVGSRYVKGGEIVGWGILRKILSRGAIFLTGIVSPVKDTMTGYLMIRKKCLNGKNFNPKGLHLLLELIVKADYEKVKEVPIKFVNRQKGMSKSNPKEVFDVLRNLIGYLPYRKNALQKKVV